MAVKGKKEFFSFSLRLGWVFRTIRARVSVPYHLGQGSACRQDNYDTSCKVEWGLIIHHDGFHSMGENLLEISIARFGALAEPHVYPGSKDHFK